MNELVAWNHEIESFPSDARDHESILGRRFVRFGCAILLLIAAALKTHQLFTDPALGVIHGSRWLQAGLVEYELLLALWLLSGICLRWGRRIALLNFLGFGCYALFLGMAGNESCGCFGQARVSPWWTFGMDLTLAVSLYLWKPRRDDNDFAPEAGHSLFAGRVFLAIIAFALVVIPALAMVAWRPAAESSQGIVFASNGFVLLEPEKWIGKPFPLTEYLDMVEQERLSQGSWIVLFYRRDCPKCRQALPHYERLAEQGREVYAGTQVALIEVPPYGPMGLSALSLCRHGRLSDNNEWLVVTPFEIRLANGRVTAANTTVVSENH